jgi:hypothetical protein
MTALFLFVLMAKRHQFFDFNRFVTKQDKLGANRVTYSGKKRMKNADKSWMGTDQAPTKRSQR